MCHILAPWDQCQSSVKIGQLQILDTQSLLLEIIRNSAKSYDQLLSAKRIYMRRKIVIFAAILGILIFGLAAVFLSVQQDKSRNRAAAENSTSLQEESLKPTPTLANCFVCQE